MFYIDSTPVFAAVSRQLQLWGCQLRGAMAGGGEPKVWELKDRYGVPYWFIYDPVGDRSIKARSEDEVRLMLERRYRAS